MKHYLLFTFVTIAGLTFCRASEELAAPDWSVPQPAGIEAELSAWLDAVKVDEAKKTAALDAWKAHAGSDVLLGVAKAVAIVKPETAALVEACSGPLIRVAPTNEGTKESLGGGVGIAPTFSFLNSGALEPFAEKNLRLFYGRALAQQRLYDEAMIQLDGLSTRDVVDPASLLFYQSIVYQRLLKQDLGVQSLRRLLQRQEDLPRRYRMIADLMHADLAKMEEESLDHISRRMEDIGRRLDLGRSDQKVREIEEGVVASLDKLIKDLEDEAKKRQQQQQSSAQSGGSRNPSKPAEESMPAQGKGPGDVARKELAAGDGWGNLSPQQRQEVLQQVTKEFPAHYRDVIEQYFRTLADESGAKDK